MTDFNRITLTVASTQGGQCHSVGFDVLTKNWPEFKAGLTARDSNKTLVFREENEPRNTRLGSKYRWIWVTMTAETPLIVLLYLAELSRDSRNTTIRVSPDEYP